LGHGALFSPTQAGALRHELASMPIRQNAFAMKAGTVNGLLQTAQRLDHFSP
jgi:hypothetical protein